MTTEYPNNLTAAEYHELAVGSAIHPDLIERNFRHIEGEEVYEYLFISPTIPRKNAGRVTDGFLKAYLHLLAGGMWISGLDPQRNWLPMEWGRLKPTQPRIDWQKGKIVKYESPPKTANRVTYFDVPDCIWRLVARRYNIKLYHSSLSQRLQDKRRALIFWEWVIAHPQIPIILCEGEKKAACLLSLGFVAIALPGIWNGRIGRRDFDERLHPDLLPLAQPGRKFQILFDYETKLKTRWSVYQATVRTGKVIEAEGCVCEVVQLPGPEKGVDDFVVARGEEANALMTAIAHDALSLKDYQQSFLLNHRSIRKYKADLIVDVQYLTQALVMTEQELLQDEAQPEASSDPVSSPVCLEPPSDNDSPVKKYKLKKSHNKEPKRFLFPASGLVVLISDMGTGKTELMRNWRLAHPDQRFLNNGHRVNLLKNLDVRLDTVMYSDLGYVGMAKAKALSITIDSLHKLNTQALTYGCIFIDEACQYLTHLLLSKTCKEHRAIILEVLHQIVYNCPLVVLSDAHMDDTTIDFFMSMRPEGEQPYIIKNEWQNGDRTIYWYEGDNSSALVAKISAAIMTGQKVMVVSDSKRFIKKLEQALLTLQTVVTDDSSNSAPPQGRRNLRIWSVHSDNSGSDENVAFIKDITNAVKNIDVLLTSPSLGTGVDISQYHFNVVFGVFHGVSQTATECAQQLWRYRPKVPIHVWVAPKPPYGYLDTNPTKIKEQLLQTNEVTAFLLRIDRETGKRGAEKDWALDAYCKIKSARHQSINNLRTDLRELLKQMGNEIVRVGDENDAETWELLKAASDSLDSAHHQAVARANNISKSEYRARQSKDYLSPEEVYECEKFRIHDSYGMEVTPELVEIDNGGRLISAIAALEAILSPPESTDDKYPTPPAIVANKDRAERDKLPFCMDWGNYSARWLARYNLGLHHILARLVAGEEVRADDQQLLKMTAIAIDCAAHIKAILGFTIPPDPKPIWLLGILLDQLGLKLTYRKQGPRGQQVKLFSLSKKELEFAQQVINHRQAKRAENQAQYQSAHPEAVVFTPPTNGIVNSPYEEGGTTALGAGGAGGEIPIRNSQFAIHNSQNCELQIDNCELSSASPASPASSLPDRNFILHGVEMLRSSISSGLEAIKGILRRWDRDLRWLVVLEWEAIAATELRSLEQLVPDFYSLLSEDVLPMEGC
ncbi:plasmid replication protein, CyRepA1 family [Anabaena azotica]|nr:plasmid replication protein, CyRepA1 family [Anabaena azotica]